MGTILLVEEVHTVNTIRVEIGDTHKIIRILSIENINIAKYNNNPPVDETDKQ